MIFRDDRKGWSRGLGRSVEGCGTYLRNDDTRDVMVQDLETRRVSRLSPRQVTASVYPVSLE